MPQKKRLVVTLDPDYVPWEHNEDVVKLQRKRLKIPKGLILALGIVAIFTVAIVGQTMQKRQENALESVATTPTVQAVDVYAGYCEFGGLLLPPGSHQIGDVTRECENGVLR